MSPNVGVGGSNRHCYVQSWAWWIEAVFNFLAGDPAGLVAPVHEHQVVVEQFSHQFGSGDGVGDVGAVDQELVGVVDAS